MRQCVSGNVSWFECILKTMGACDFWDTEWTCSRTDCNSISYRIISLLFCGNEQSNSGVLETLFIRVVLSAMYIFKFIYFKLQPPEFVIVKKTLLVNFFQIPTTFTPPSSTLKFNLGCHTSSHGAATEAKLQGRWGRGKCCQIDNRIEWILGVGA